MKAPVILIILMVFLVLFPLSANADILVEDDVSVTGQPVMLAARTKGLILPRGGEVVEFRADGVLLGRNLSGGDGWAYREFRPDEEKLYEIIATSRGEEGRGYLLVTGEGKGIVFIDVLGSLFKAPFSRTPMEGSREAVERIRTKSPVVYLYTDLPEAAVRAWLDENSFPKAPVLGWRDGRVFDYVSVKGLRVEAVVGSAGVVESALEHGEKLFTFGTSDEATEVDSWEEVEEGLE